MKNNIDYKLSFPDDVKVDVVGDIVTITGPKGTVEKKMSSHNVKLASSGNEVSIKSLRSTQREKKLANTFRAHVKHMVVGVMEGHSYKLKVCSGHFPMTVTQKGDVLEVKNFLGESKPRLLKIKSGVELNIQGSDITISSPNKELAGQVAADIEQLTRITNRDRRIFQDGIYIVEKSRARPIVLEEVAE